MHTDGHSENLSDTAASFTFYCHETSEMRSRNRFGISLLHRTEKPLEI